MIQAAHTEILRLTRLQQGAELQLMLLTGRSSLSNAEQSRLAELEQRLRQLLDRIAWFEAILREHDSAAE